jgi:Ca-activated chloride channel family protein
VSEFRFADPQWVHALWGVLGFVALLLWLDRRSGSALGRVVAEALQHRLVRGPSGWRRRLGIALLGLAGACLVVALMRPQWGLRHVPTQRVGAEIMVCLDVSRSMLAEDVAPNRLERAKAEIADLLGYFEGDQIGLIAFAGRASVLAPLTPDFSFLRLVLDGVGVHSVTRGGTRLEAPIRQAVEGFGPPGEVSRAILLITDGEDHDSFPLDAAAEAAELGIAIIAIGFGDEDGSEVYLTDPRSGARSLLRDGDGRPVRSRLDGELLRELASATGGAWASRCWAWRGRVWWSR